MKKYFFDTDNSSHWYMVPADKRERWNELNTEDEEDDEKNAAFDDEFGEYRLGGGPHGEEFYLSDEEAEKLWR